MKIKTYAELENIVKHIRQTIGLNTNLGFVEHFRGQSHNKYKLLSGLGRYGFAIEKLIEGEKNIFREFKYQIESGIFEFIQVPFYPEKFPYKKDWFHLFQAQHIGLHTRMTDWTMNFEVALYFCVEDENNFGIDGQFWYFCVPPEFICNSFSPNNLKSIYDTHPFSNEKNLMINQPFYQNESEIKKIAEDRRFNQSGRFFIQASSKIKTPLEEQEDLKPYLQKFIVDGKSKESIKNELIERGITKEFIYPAENLNIKKKINCLNKLINK